jgi:hypothetical protein
MAAELIMALGAAVGVLALMLLVVYVTVRVDQHGGDGAHA